MLGRMLKLRAAILAGGKSTRFGRDKSLESFSNNNEPYTVSCYHMLIDMNLDPFIISDNSNKFSSYGIKSIVDSIPDKGPLGGIYTGIIHTNTDAILVLTCDMPYVIKNMLEKLMKNYMENKRSTFFTIDTKIYPFPGIYSASSFLIIKQCLDENKLSVIECIKMLNYKNSILGKDFKSCFCNMNTPY